MWKLDLGIVGLGYWGPNLLRSLNRIGRVRLKYACDLDEGKRARFAAQYPETRFT